VRSAVYGVLELASSVIVLVTLKVFFTPDPARHRAALEPDRPKFEPATF